MKYYRMSYKEVVFKRAYITIMLLNAAIPGIKPIDTGKNESSKTPDKKIHANNYFSQFM